MKTRVLALLVVTLTGSCVSCSSIKKLTLERKGDETRIETELLPQDPLTIDSELMGP